MLYFKVTRGAKGKALQARVLSENEANARHTIAEVETRNDWRTFDKAKEVAALLGDKYIAVDYGSHVSPRYDVINMPQVGDAISYGYNGDAYPCGHIKSISESKKLIVSTEGHKFYRRGQSGTWKYAQTWSLMSGHFSNHRLRERRLKLGATQYLVGLLADYPTGVAQHNVSAVERGVAPAKHVERVRRAIIWLETEARRKREADRADAAAVTQVESAMQDLSLHANENIVLERLVDLLWDGRTEDFDALAARLPKDLVERAVNMYLDGIKPNV